MHNLLNSIPSLYTSRHAYPPCTAEALYAPSAAEKGSESEGSAGVVLELVKHFFFFPFNPDIKDSLNVLGGFALTADVHGRRPKKTSARWEKFALHRTEEKLNIAGFFFFWGRT